MADLESTHLLYFNGVDAETGGYLFQPLTIGELVALALDENFEGRDLDALER